MNRVSPPAKRSKSKKPGSYGENAYIRLKQAIQDGLFKPGEPIREARVAQWLHVSRTPIRDAIRRLQNEGLLSHRLHEGVVVSTLAREDILNLYAMREVLEGAAASMAARHASDVEIASMRGIVDASRQARDARRIADLNYRFHALIHEAARNPYLTRTLTTFRESLALLGPPTTVLPGRPSEADKAHEEILGAIEQRDARAAEDAMRAHIRSALLRRFELLERPEAATDQTLTYPRAVNAKRR